MTQLKEKIAERLAAAGSTVADRVAEQLAEKEVTRRVTIVVNALPKLEELQAKRKKIEDPDDVRFDATDPTNLREVKSYTKGRIEERKRLDMEIQRLMQAFESALTSADAEKQEKSYAELEKLTQPKQ